MKRVLLISAFACLVSSAANAACIAPKGSYVGASAGLSISDGSTPMTIKGVENVRIFANYASNGSGTMTVEVSSVYTFFGKLAGTNNFTFLARGTSSHIWNPTTCQGTLTVFENGNPSRSFWYTVVQSGKEIILNSHTVPGTYTTTLKKL